LWLIDHGASFYFHHGWQNLESQAGKPFLLIKDHVLLSKATEMEKAAGIFSKTLTSDVIEEITSLVPEDWLTGDFPSDDPEINRKVYSDFIIKRMELADTIILKTADDARKTAL
jgi:hypothetical protein